MTEKDEQKQDALDVGRSADFLRRERNVQRFGVAFLILFVAAGLGGAFGNGPLADATVQSGNCHHDRATSPGSAPGRRQGDLHDNSGRSGGAAGDASVAFD